VNNEKEALKRLVFRLEKNCFCVEQKEAVRLAKKWLVDDNMVLLGVE
jgi:hypothetical protein